MNFFQTTSFGKGESYVHSLGSVLFALLFASSFQLEAQSPACSFLLNPLDPEPGDTATIEVSLNSAWTLSGRDDTLDIVYAYSGVQFDPGSQFQVTDECGWLDVQEYSASFTVDQSAHELHLQLVFPDAFGAPDSGYLLIVGYVEVVIDEYILRQARTQVSSTVPLSLRWERDELQVQVLGEEFLEEIDLYSLSGQQLIHWAGTTTDWKVSAAEWGESILLIRIRTDQGVQFHKLGRR